MTPNHASQRTTPGASGHAAHPVKRTMVSLAATVLLPFLATSCSSLQQRHDQQRRKHAYQESLSRLRFPTTRARLYAALPPASPARTSIISGIPFTATEGYKLDAGFSITMSVRYVHPPSSASMDDFLFRPLTIHRSPKDSILSASLNN